MKRSKNSWVRLPIRVLSEQDLSLRAKVVLALMIDQQTEDGTTTVTADDLAYMMGADTRTARRAIKELKDARYITDVKQGCKPMYKLIQVLEPKGGKKE